MSKYYRPRRIRNLYKPGESQPYRLSRSRIELFMQCRRCFYFDRRLGVDRPPGFPFALNNAVDTLLKKEFDLLRQKGQAHPLMKKYGIDAYPARHKRLEAWRNNFQGIQHLHEPTNFLITGAIDDLWQDSKKRYIVVDYKSTSKNGVINALNQDWQDGYKRQMEIYQWLLRKEGYKVSDCGYFVYCNGRTDLDKFNAKLEFEITLVPYTGDDSWINQTLFDIQNCLGENKIPAPSKDCDYCSYRDALKEVKKEFR